MFSNLKLRTKLLAIALPPLLVLAIISAYAVLLSSQGGSSIDELSSDIRTLGIVCLASVLLSALTMVIIGRSIVNPVDDLKRSALEVANERLPLLVDVLSRPGAAVPTFEPLVTDQHDELGDLVGALNAIQDRVVEIANAQQVVVQAGVSDLVINLARRNQSLLDRQLELIDRLEQDEEDPDRLEELFGLDHLATRMRRNAESLLVLAGAESTRRRGRPVQMADSIRVAMSEIENYQHVNLTDVEAAEVSSSLALDLAHLLSELLENATQFSPPDRPVEVRGSKQSDGGYVVAVIDRGIGMSSDQLIDANATLAMPPELSLGMSRSLGFVVVGHLARRLGSSVSLTPTPGGGTTATVLLGAARMTEQQTPSTFPSETLRSQPAPVAEVAAPPAPPAPPAPAPVAFDVSDIADPLAAFRDDAPTIPAMEPVFNEPVIAQPPVAQPAVPESLVAPAYPEKLSEAMPIGEAFDSGIEALLAPSAPDRTSSGLVKRDRTQSRAPIDEGRPATPSERSPAEIRSMLARYREGLKGRPLSELADDNPASDPFNPPSPINDEHQGDRA
ncbi:MAG: ATP-binding protein [Acidimicrobiales bacterium]